MSLLNPWVLLGIAAALVLSFLSGMRVQSDHTKAQLLAQERAMHEAYVGKVKQFRAIAQGVSKDLNDEQSKRYADKLAFDGELRRSRASGKPLAVCPTVSTDSGQSTGLDKPTASVRLPEPRLTGEFARLYDAGSSIGVPSTGDSGRTDAPAEGPGVVDPETVLAINAANGEAWAECRATVRGWQSLARRYGWAQ